MRLRSQNEHRITETEEAVFLFHSHLVGMHGLVVAIQCGNEHDQGALRQVEVGDQAVDAVELDARVQENGGIAAAGANLAVLGRYSFKVRQLVVPTAITR